MVWPTDRGYLNLGRINRETENTLAVKYRLETGATIVARPAYLPPDPKTLGDAGMVFAASCDGFLYAVQEETGETLWRFSTGEPIVESPAVIDDRVYVTTQLGGMYSPRHEDRQESLVGGRRRCGSSPPARRGCMPPTAPGVCWCSAPPAAPGSIPSPPRAVSSILANSDTDRIYLISNGGLIQCFREAEQTEPLLHNKERKDAAKAGLIPPPSRRRRPPRRSRRREHAAPKTPTVPKERKDDRRRTRPEGKAARKSGKKGGGQDDARRSARPVRKAGKDSKTAEDAKVPRQRFRNDRLSGVVPASPLSKPSSCTAWGRALRPIDFAERLNHASPFTSRRALGLSCWRPLCRRPPSAVRMSRPPNRGRPTGPSSSIGPDCRICSRSTPGSIAAPSPRPRESRS